MKKESFINYVNARNYVTIHNEDAFGMQLPMDTVGISTEIEAGLIRNDGLVRTEIGELNGVILASHPYHVYQSDFSANLLNSGNCRSLDGEFGYGNPGGACIDCWHRKQYLRDDFDEYETCYPLRVIYLLPAGECVPVIVVLNAYETTAYAEYVKGCANKGLRMHEIETRFYSDDTLLMHFEMVRYLEQEEQESINEVRDCVKTDILDYAGRLSGQL